MTTKPKARKYRTGRRGAAADGSVNPDETLAENQPPADLAEAVATDASDAPTEESSPAPQAPGDGEPPLTTAESEIKAIKAEGLTSRQLRMARRVALKHNLSPSSDFDAVRLLRLQDIDPFTRSNMLELVVPRDDGPQEKEKGAHPSSKVQLPQTVPTDQPSLPSIDVSPAERRDNEIGQMQRDMMRRRRRRLMFLLIRLSFFVLLPTILAGTYFYKYATPMYGANSEFLILKADNAGGSGLGGLLSGTQFATSQDSIAVQSYLQSKDAMLRLDRDMGFKSHFMQDWIDPIQRLSPDATNEEAYKIYKKNVKIGYDPTEGVIRMEVVAVDPLLSADFSKRLISYAEERVNGLSQQKRGDQMKDAEEGFESAKAERQKAQVALVELQQKGALLDPEGVIASLRGQINNIELQLQDKQLQLAALMDNARPNKAKVDGAKGDIGRLEDLLTSLNKRMNDASKGENSLAQLSVNIQMAQADLAARDMMLQSALQQVEQTRMEANRQVRYLTVSVNPVPSQEATYPRKFENTVLAFLIFSGIYLMISITASILREQVTS